MKIRSHEKGISHGGFCIGVIIMACWQLFKDLSCWWQISSEYKNDAEHLKLGFGNTKFDWETAI